MTEYFGFSVSNQSRTVVNRSLGSNASYDGHQPMPEPVEPVEAVVHLLAALLTSRSGASAEHGKNPQPMLTVAQTASLLGVSRMTVIRKADAGELPCVIVSRGKHQKLRRFPSALVKDLALHGGYDTHSGLRECADAWMTRSTLRGIPGEDFK